MLYLVEPRKFSLLQVISSGYIAHGLILLSSHTAVDIVAANVCIAPHESSVLYIHPLLVLTQHFILIGIRQRPHSPRPPDRRIMGARTNIEDLSLKQNTSGCPKLFGAGVERQYSITRHQQPLLIPWLPIPTDHVHIHRGEGNPLFHTIIIIDDMISISAVVIIDAARVPKKIILPEHTNSLP